MTEPGIPSGYVVAAAVLSGWPAYAIGRLLTRCHDEVADLPPHLRQPIEDATDALRLAGAAWVSARGSAEALPAEAPVSSQHEPDALDTQEVADMLRLSARRVRQLATRGRLPGSKRHGRWTFDRGAVIAHRTTTGGTP